MIDVVDRSVADEAGLVPGDVIISYERSEIATTAELTTRIRESEPGETVDMELVDAEGTRVVEATIGERSLSQ